MLQNICIHQSWRKYEKEIRLYFRSLPNFKPFLMSCVERSIPYFPFICVWVIVRSIRSGAIVWQRLIQMMKDLQAEAGSQINSFMYLFFSFDIVTAAPNTNDNCSRWVFDWIYTYVRDVMFGQFQISYLPFSGQFTINPGLSVSSQSSNCLQKVLFTIHEMRCLVWTTALAYICLHMPSYAEPIRKYLSAVYRN